MNKSSILPVDPASFEQPVSSNKERKKAISLTYYLTIANQVWPPKSRVLSPHTQKISNTTIRTKSFCDLYKRLIRHFS